MRIVQASIVAFALVASPAIAGDSSEKKAPDPDKVICKVDRTTGSSISERICKKRSVWEEEKEAAKRNLQDRHMNTNPEFLKGKGG